MRSRLAHVEPGQLILPNLYPKQHKAIYDAVRYSIIEASTKAGKTLGCITWILDQWWRGTVGQNFWWVAPVFPQARIAFDRIRNGLSVTHGVKFNKGDKTITSPQGAVLWFKSADNPDSLYGDDVYAAVIDEASRCKEEAWHAVRSTLTATKGPCRIIGNVKGRKNWAYRLARMAQGGTPNMGYHRLTAYDAAEGGVIDIEEIEDAKRMLPEHVFKELYLAEPSEDGGNPFGLDAIAKCVRPLSQNPVVAWGCDLAKVHDWTVLIGLDTEGAVAHFERWQSPWKETIKRLRTRLPKKKRDGAVYIDSTGVGDPIVEELQSTHQSIEGFHFSSGSKQQIMEGLGSAIQQEEVFFPDGQIVSELNEFEYEYTRTGVRYSAPEGFFDDSVCALALAWARLRDRPVTKVAGSNNRVIN